MDGDDVLLWVIVAIVAIALFSGASFGVYASFFSDWSAINWRGIYEIVVMTFVVIDAIFVFLFIFILWRFHKLDTMESGWGEVTTHVVPLAKEVRKNWEYIEELLSSPNPSDWNMAVIHADALLDDALVHLGYEGDTMGERLKIVDPVQMPSIERVWSAHKLRNMIVHDPVMPHTKESIAEAIRVYRDALQELKAFGKEQS